MFRPEEGARLSGPKVLGKIDVQSFEKKKGEDGHRRREKRKRITKDKVDITQKQNQMATARPTVVRSLREAARIRRRAAPSTVRNPGCATGKRASP